MKNLFAPRLTNADNLFDDHFLDAKALYLHFHSVLPNMDYIGQIDGEKAFELIKSQFSQSIEHVHRYRYYKRDKKKYQFGRTVMVLRNKCILEFDDYYCEILHDGKQEQFVSELTGLIGQFKMTKKREPLEINLVVQHRGHLGLKAMEVKRTKLDFDLFYEDDFTETRQLINKRLNQKNDKGIVLLHGLPGTGKTTYLRYLIGKVKKRVLFLSPLVAGNLMSPEFIELLTENPNTILVIEDAENIIVDRAHNSSSAVSNLLNISDGLLSDFLNVQLVCTFNSMLTMVDSALLRKGRLIARYEFGKLGIGKSQRLSDHLGFKTIISKPMTIAEIANQHEKDQNGQKIEIIGFRRETVLQN